MILICNNRLYLDPEYNDGENIIFSIHIPDDAFLMVSDEDPQDVIVREKQYAAEKYPPIMCRLSDYEIHNIYNKNMPSIPVRLEDAMTAGWYDETIDRSPIVENGFYHITTSVGDCAISASTYGCKGPLKDYTRYLIWLANHTGTHAVELMVFWKRTDGLSTGAIDELLEQPMIMQLFDSAKWDHRITL